AIAIGRPCLLLGVHVGQSGYRGQMRLIPCVRAHTIPATLRHMRTLADPEARSRWIAWNTAHASDYLQVDPERPAAARAVRLLAEAADGAGCGLSRAVACITVRG